VTSAVLPPAELPLAVVPLAELPLVELVETSPRCHGQPVSTGSTSGVVGTTVSRFRQAQPAGMAQPAVITVHADDPTYGFRKGTKCCQTR
jgi:hypothetical protein